MQLPYLDKITFKVIEDSTTTGQALRSGDIDIFSTSSAAVISDFRDDADFPMAEQSDFVETNYLLIDLQQGRPVRRTLASGAHCRRPSTARSSSTSPRADC